MRAPSAWLVFVATLLVCCAPPRVARQARPSAPVARGGLVAPAPPALTALAPRPPRSAEESSVRLVPQLQHTKNIDSVVFSPDGTLALTTGDASIKLWDTSTLTVLRTLKGHTSSVEQVAFLPDGRRALSASEDHTINLWDIATGGVLGTGKHDAWVTSLAIAADGHRAIAGDLDGKVKVWDVGGLRAIQSIDAHPAGHVEVNIAPDGKVFVSTGKDDVIKVWDANSGKLLRTLTDEPSKTPVLKLTTKGNTLSATRGIGRERIVTMAFTPDGRRLLAASESAITVWDMAKGTRVRRIPAEHALSVNPFKDGKRAIVASSYSRGLTEWNIETGVKLRTFPAAQDEAFLASALSPDEQRILTGTSTGEGQTLRLFDATHGQLLASKSNAESSVWGATVSPDGRRVVSACGDGSIRIWDTHGVRLERTIKAKDLMPVSVAVSPDNKRVLAAGWDHDLRAWNIETGALEVDYTGDEGDFSIDAVAYSPNGSRVVAILGHDVGVWDVSGGAPLRKLTGHTDDVHALAFLPDGKRLVSASQDGSIKLWDVESGKLLDTFEVSQESSFFAVAASPDGHHIAGAGRQGTIYIWEVDEPDTFDFLSSAHPSSVASLAYAPDGKRLLSGGEDFTMRLWNLDTHRLERTFGGHENQVTGVAFSPDGLYALSSSYDESTRLWRLDDGYSMAMAARAGDWLVHTSDGYFDASRRGGDFVAAVQGNRAFRIDQLALTNNRPDRMMEGMGFTDESTASYYRARFQRRVRRLGLAEDRLSRNFDKAPTAKITSSKRDASFLDVSFELSDPNGKLFRYNVYVNDVPLLGMVGRPITGSKQALSERVELGTGSNKIEVGVLNENGAEALRPFVVIDGPPKPKGDLYFLGFGVSHYKNPNYDLEYPHKDVLDIAAVLKTKQDAFHEVHVATYVNEEVTVANVKKAKDFLRAARTDDTVVLFVSGHGLHSSAATGEYYYATWEVDPTHLPETAANFEVVEDLLQGIAPRKKLFLMDTCESGERDEDETMSSTVAPRAKGLRPRSTQAIAKDAAPAQSAPAKPIVIDRERYIENDLARRSGAIVLSSSRGAEHSFELDELQNGAFTESILAALTTDAADDDHDGSVSTDELRVYVAKEVGRLTADKQHPTIDRDNIDVKFGLPVITAAHAVQTRADPLPLRPRVAAGPPPLGIAPRAPHGCGCCAVPAERETGSIAGALAIAVTFALGRRRRGTPRLS